MQYLHLDSTLEQFKLIVHVHFIMTERGLLEVSLFYCAYYIGNNMTIPTSTLIGIHFEKYQQSENIRLKCLKGN